MTRRKEIKQVVLFALCIICTACIIGCEKETAKNSSNTQETNLAGEGNISETKNTLKYPVIIKLGYSTKSNDPRGVASQLFKEKVESETNGRIQIEIFDAGQLGSDSELISGVIDGSVDMTVSSAGNFAAYATRVGVSALPFLFSDFSKAWRFMDSNIMTEVSKDLEEYNIHVLSYFDNGFRCITTSEKIGPVNSVSDLNGVVIRTSTNQIVMETMSELGANPKSYPFGELVDALKTGKFDAQENPIPVIYNSQLYKVQKYLAVTNHSYDAMPFVIRKDIWDNLSEEEQRILKEAAVKAQDENRKMIKEQTTEYVEKLQNEGMIITYPDLERFKEHTEGVSDVFSTVYGEKLLTDVKQFTE